MDISELHDEDDWCAWCGAELPVDRYYGRRKHCSKQCLQRHNDALDQQARQAARQGRACAHCGGEIPVERRASARFCSKRCNQRDRAAKRKASERTGRTCLYCGDTIPGDKQRGAKFCSRACGNSYSAGWSQPDYENRVCAECGGHIPVRRGVRAKYCSKACYDVVNRRRASRR